MHASKKTIISTLVQILFCTLAIFMAHKIVITIRCDHRECKQCRKHTERTVLGEF